MQRNAAPMFAILAGILTATFPLMAQQATAVARRTRPAPYPLELWNDPAFRKSFLRGYGALSEVEPPLNDVERGQMAKISAAMGTDPEECRRALEEVTTPESSAEFDFVLGQLSFQTGRPVEKTVQHYEAAIKKLPSFRRALYALGRVLAQIGNYEGALASLSRAAELGQADGTLYGMLGFCHLALENAASAESSYRLALVFQPKSFDWKMGLIRALLKQQKADDVIALCDELLAIDPTKAEVWSLQSNAFIAKKDFLRAAGNLELLAAQGRTSAQDLARLGDLYMSEKLNQPALGAYKLAFNQPEPVAVTEAVRMVEVLSSRGAVDESEELLAELRKAYGRGLSDAEQRKLMKIAARIAVAKGEGGEAVETLEQVVALDPLDGEALMLLAQHYASTGEKERAVLTYQRVESIEGFEADAGVKHAQLIAGMGKLDEAISLLKRAQQLKPRDSVGKFLEELERFQKTRR